MKKIKLVEKPIANTINGQAISLQEYRERNERAEASYAEGKYKTSDQLKEKFKSK